MASVPSHPHHTCSLARTGRSSDPSSPPRCHLLAAVVLSHLHGRSTGCPAGETWRLLIRSDVTAHCWHGVIHRRHGQRLSAWQKRTPSIRPTSDAIPREFHPQQHQKSRQTLRPHRRQVKRASSSSAATEPSALTSVPIGAPINACDRMGLYKLFRCSDCPS